MKTDAQEAGEEPEHTVMTIRRQPFAFIIRTGGRIMSDSKDVEIVTAKSSGIVKFSSHTFFPGVKVAGSSTYFQFPASSLPTTIPDSGSCR
ncbi:MAG: hypothetical protein MZV63_24215 [Marinilabiliales bacterium]|nr:hypothetical protein [Marinilabiliales bacterium]